MINHINLLNTHQSNEQNVGSLKANTKKFTTTQVLSISVYPLLDGM